jgi:HPt (histidine-containing phosphotransfer) domain-containing protein/HAMP domain-containing protein/two-component sensor histidine kinase
MLGRWFNSIKRRSLVAVGLIMILFGIMFASHYSLTRQSLQLLHSSEGRTFPILQLLDRSLTRLKDYQESLQAAVATNDEYAIDDARVIGREIEEYLQKVASLDASLETRVSPILKHFQDYRQSAEDLTRRVIAKEISFSGEDSQIKDYFAIQEENFQRINAFRDEIHSYYIQEIRQISDSSETTISRGVMLIIVSLLIAFFILIFLQKSIIKPILALANASRKAALGEFSQVPQRLGQDEVSQLTNDFNQMIHALDMSSHTMSSIIEHGRRMAVSSSLAKLRQALSDGLTAFSNGPLPHEFWVSLRTLVRGESVDRRFLLVSPEGELLSETCNLEELEKQAHISVRNHLDDSTMAVIVCFEPDFDHSPVKNFLEAVAIHVASALDSIKLQDTMNLVKEQSQSMRTLLENIDQGICTIDSALNIRGPYSPFLETIVGVQGLEGVSFVEAVIRKSTLNTEQKSILINILNVSFGEDIFVYEVNRHQLVRELEWWKDSQKIICEIDWIPLTNREGLTERFMIVLRDVTHLRLLQTEAEANMKKLGLIDVLLHIEPRRFRLVTADCQKTIMSIQESLGVQDRSLSVWQALRRDLHTEKGNLRALGLTNVSMCLHELEDGIESYLRSPAHDSGHERINLEHQIRMANNELALVCQLFYDTLKRGHAAQASTSLVQDQELLLWLDHLESLPSDRLMSELTLFRERTCKSAPYGSPMLVSRLEDAARKLAQELGQKAPQILWIGTPLLFRVESFNSILSALHHMLRNSLDHGFATARHLDQPMIRLEAEVHANGLLHLTYQDNGSGLNLKHLHAIASRMQLHLTKDDDALAELIFTQGVSVKESVTEISGRGIGMDAVRNSFQNLGGSIKVRFTAPETNAGYRSFAFDIELAAQDTLVWPLSNPKLHVA